MSQCCNCLFTYLFLYLLVRSRCRRSSVARSSRVARRKNKKRRHDKRKNSRKDQAQTRMCHWKRMRDLSQTRVLRRASRCRAGLVIFRRSCTANRLMNWTISTTTNTYVSMICFWIIFFVFLE